MDATNATDRTGFTGQAARSGRKTGACLLAAVRVVFVLPLALFWALCAATILAAAAVSWVGLGVLILTLF